MTGTSTYQLSGDYRLDEAGLCLDDAYITTPVYFNGEMSVKIVFELDVSELSTAFIEFGISDGILWNGNNETWAGLWDIGNEMEEGWKLGDYGWGEQEDHEHEEPIPNLNRDGSNTVEFKRIGNTVLLYINGDKIGEADLIYFDIHTDGFFPTISCKGAIGTLTIKSVEVRYNGGISEEWPV